MRNPAVARTARHQGGVSCVCDRTRLKWCKLGPRLLVIAVALGLIFVAFCAQSESFQFIPKPSTSRYSDLQQQRKSSLHELRRGVRHVLFGNGGAASKIIRTSTLVTPALVAAFPDLAIWLAGPANVRRALCEAVHPGLKRTKLPIPRSGRARTDVGGYLNLSSVSLDELPDAIPVVVLSHNNPTYLLGMVRFLRCYGIVDIVVYDTASSLPLHVQLLDALEHLVTVQRLPTNDGPRSFFNASNLASMPRFFALTDADLRPHPDLPPNFLTYLAALTQVFPGRKVGFALDLTMRDQFLQGDYAKGLSISQWEEQFWTRPLSAYASSDALYDAQIDTTFAVYDKTMYKPDAKGDIAWPYDGIRVGGTFTATHVPWLRYATARYQTNEEWAFMHSHENEWSTTGKLAHKNAQRRGDVRRR